MNDSFFAVTFSGSLLIMSIPPKLISQTVELRHTKTIQLSKPERDDFAQSRLTSIAVNLQNDIYAIDASKNSVMRFNSEGEFVREVGGFGWQDEQFDSPVAIWAENGLDVFVADYNNSRIQRFDRKLNFVASILGRQAEDQRLQFAFPIAVSFSNFGELFIAEREHNRVLKLNAEFEPVESFGDYDWGAGVLGSPVSLAVFEDKAVFVADNERRSVIQFDYFGNFLNEILLENSSPVAEIAVSREHIFILEERTNDLKVFAHDGSPVLQSSPQFPTANQKITSLALTRNVLYLLDSAQNVVFCYSIGK